MEIILIISLLAIIAFLSFFIAKKLSELKKIRDKYKDIIDIDEEIEKSQKNFDSEITKQNKILVDAQKEIEKLKNNYSDNLSIYKNLLKEKSVLEEDLELISYGLYKPHFDFDTSEKYKAKMTENYNKQKELTQNKKAVVCPVEWTVEGSKAKGQKMTNQSIKLMARAFNNECDSAILKTKWNNIEKMEARIEKAFENINKLGESNRISITREYFKLKLDELFLTYEYQRKLQDEKEEQKRIQEQIREEEKRQKEIDQAQKEAEKEEDHYQKALLQAQKEMEKAKDEELSVFQDKIAALEEQLKLAQEKKERAIAQAQLTKSGHIYVISNIGSFGENVYKIGMTRRLEPMDRVNELGDASVPFKFDVHAFIYSENAPELEKKLHDYFKNKSVNLINFRKEFFNVDLEEIEKFVNENHGQIEFIKVVEAKEYRETIAIKEKATTIINDNEKIENKFPMELPI